MNKLIHAAFLMLLIAMGCLVSLNSCKKNEPTDIPKTTFEGDYIVVGKYYGECMGENCIRFYALSNNKVYKSESTQYPDMSNAYLANYTLTTKDATILQPIWNLIPPSIYTINDGVIGQPDAGDWGGLYLEVKQGTNHRYWYIDNANFNLPQNIIPCKEFISLSIEELSR